MLKNPPQWDKVEIELKQFGVGTDISPKPLTATALNCFISGIAEARLEGEPIGLKQGDYLWVPPGTNIGFKAATDISYWHVRLRTGLWAHQVDADQEIVAAIKQLDQKSHYGCRPFTLSKKSSQRTMQVFETMQKLHAHIKEPLQRAALKAQAIEMIRLLILDPKIAKLPAENIVEIKKLEARKRIAPALVVMDRSKVISEEICSIDQLAAACHMKSSRFHSLFIQATGTTPIRYLNQKRIDLACNQLSRTNRKVIDIAYSVGYHSLSRFYSAFRQFTGTTPRKWRKAYRHRDEED